LDQPCGKYNREWFEPKETFQARLEVIRHSERCITKKEVDEGLEIFEEVITMAEKEQGLR
jgi:hypothetical protein